MKNLILVIAFFIPLAGHSQRTDIHTGQDVTYYLDSVEFDPGKVYLNPKNIQSVNVVKEESAVYIVSKSPGIFLTLNEAVEKHIQPNDIAQPVLYMIDDRIILDKSAILIDSTYLKSVEAVDLSEANYLDKEAGNLTVIKISLSPDSDKKGIRIRGLVSTE